MNARRVALRIVSGKNILNFAFGATAFAERSVAMKAPVGLLSGRAVCALADGGALPRQALRSAPNAFSREGSWRETAAAAPLSAKAQRGGKAGSPSQALPRQLPRRGSQAVKFVAKVLGITRRFPAVLLALPLGELSNPQGLTERAGTLKEKNYAAISSH